MELENQLFGLLSILLGIGAFYLMIKNQSKDFDPALADEGLFFVGIMLIGLGIAALFGAIDIL